MAYTREPLMDDGAIITGRVGTLGKVYCPAVPSWPSDNTLLVTPNDPRKLRAIQFIMERADLSALNRGSTQPLLTQKDLKSLSLVDPTAAVWDAWHLTSQDLLSLATSLIEQSSTLGDVRDTLLPRLLSGELRIDDAEKVAEEAL